MNKLFSLALIFLTLSILLGCQSIPKQSIDKAQKTYDPTWESLKEYEVPEWWLDTKFGIYFHWGPYAVPAHQTEWYSHWMYEEGHPIRKYHEETFVMANQPTSPLPKDSFNADWLARLNELMDKYEPDIIWFDNKMDIIEESYRQQFLASYYNKAQLWEREVVCTYKSSDMAKGTAILDLERSRMSEKKEFPWLTDDSVDWGAWCDVKNPDYKSTNRLIDFLIDVVSKNGALLLNITPKANGEIPQPVKDRLLEMGEWLTINGEAIYGTRPWKIYGQGPTQVVEGHLSEHQNEGNTSKDIRFTTKGDTLYAFVLDWPDSEAIIPALGRERGVFDSQIGSVELLGSQLSLTWEQAKDGLRITMPSQKPCEHAYVFRILRK